MTVESDPPMERVKFVSVGYAFNADKVDGYDATELRPSPIGDPVDVFLCYEGTTSDSPVELCPVAPFNREITSIMASSTGGALSIYIGGQLKFYIRFTTTNVNHTWSANGGAGILVESGESITFSVSDNSAQVTIVGFEY